jgi:hypothetical protein
MVGSFDIITEIIRNYTRKEKDQLVFLNDKFLPYCTTLGKI